MSAQGVQNISLADTLAAAMERGKMLQKADYSEGYQSSSWLAALPSISLGYLNSQTNGGTDEAEISLNLPVKSPYQRDIDRQLKGLTSSVTANRLKQRQLFFSGFIRESIWSHQIATLHHQNALEKQQILERLEQRFVDLHEANATSKYGLLLAQQEMLNSKIAALEYQQEADKWLAQYQQITGLQALPDYKIEPELTNLNFTYTQHPAIVGLDLGWQQQQAILLASSPRSVPWSVSVTAKKVDSPGFSENQLGLGIDIPLTFIKMTSQSQSSQWLQARKQYQTERDNTLVETQKQWNSVIKARQFLNNKAQLLASALALSEEINQHMSTLQSHNAVNQEIILRRMLDAKDTQTAFSINQVLQNQNKAMLRQAAGISL